MPQLRRRVVGATATPGREVGCVSRFNGAGLQTARLFKFPVTSIPKTVEAELIEAQILSLLSERDDTASACPSEIAVAGGSTIGG